MKDWEKRFDEKFVTYPASLILPAWGGNKKNKTYKNQRILVKNCNKPYLTVRALKHFLATALEEQKQEYEVKLKEAIEKLKEQEYQSVDLPYDENTFEHGVNEGLFQGIVALEAILNGKE